MNEEKLEQIKKVLIKSRTKTKKAFIYAGFIIFVCAVTIAQIPSKPMILCYISPQQKELLKEKISFIASTQKVSEYRLFRHMKATLKYETIGKMPCDKYTKALEYLENVERQVLN